MTKLILTTIAIALLLACFWFAGYYTGRTDGRSEPIDTETVGELRAEAAMELYEIGASCGNDLCVKAFEAMAQRPLSVKEGVITEDDPRWDCRTMGDKVCG